ncbi:MAG: response regulator transcription factor [Bryobacterales bacterium]|nr:response regulator transcription factor [Bryobacterales bacterium]
MRLLIVDGEKGISEFLAHSLAGVGYQVECLTTGEEALARLATDPFDLLILELALPDIDGLRLLEKIRNRKGDIPVIVLSGRATVEERVRGLEMGADDYMVKPFALIELQARIKAVLRRAMPSQDRLQVADLTLDCVRRRVSRGSRQIDLAPKEFDILEYLMRNAGQNLSRTQIVQHVWERDYDGLTNIVDVYIRHLRSKVDDAHAIRLIQTVRGVGYTIQPREAVPSARFGA